MFVLKSRLVDPSRPCEDVVQGTLKALDLLVRLSDDFKVSVHRGRPLPRRDASIDALNARHHSHAHYIRTLSRGALDPRMEASHSLLPSTTTLRPHLTSPTEHDEPTLWHGLVQDAQTGSQ